MYKLASLISSADKKNNTTSDVYIAQPDANKEALAGKLFVLAEIESTRLNALKIINFLTTALNHNYYQNEKMILRERISTIKVEQIFESALAKTNHDLLDFLNKEKIKISARAFNLTAGLIYENELHFSITGKNRSFLIFWNDREEKAIPSRSRRPARETTPVSRYQLVDLTKKGEATEDADLNKLFSDLISGPMPVSSYFLFANEALPEYLSNRQIIDFITKLPPNSAAEQIKNTLETINSFASICGIIIKNTTNLAPENARVIEHRENVASSIANLTTTEDKTEKIMSPAGPLGLKKLLSYGPLARISLPSISERKFFLKEKVFVKRKDAFIIFKRAWELILGFFGLVYELIRRGIKLITDPEQRTALKLKIIKTIRQIQESIQKTINWFKNLNKKNKIIIVTALVCLILFGGGLIGTAVKNKNAERLASIKTLLASAELNQDKIDADLLYNNENDARQLLASTTEMVNQLQALKATGDAWEKIKQRFDEQTGKISHAVKIDNPTEVANFANLNQAATPENIILAGQQIFAGDSTAKNIYTVNLSDQSTTVISDKNNTVKQLIYPTLNKTGDTVYYLDENTLAKLDIGTKELATVGFGYPVPRSNFVAAAGYNNRLYLLDKVGGQIYRFQRQGAGFDNGQTWLKNNTDFSSAISFSIDTSVYVLLNNGQVQKFSSGEAENFALAEVTPTLSAPTKIIVSDDKDFIYILEPKNNRLVVFTKTGSFATQYQFPTLTNLKDFAIDEANKKIYLLNNTSVYRVEVK